MTTSASRAAVATTAGGPATTSAASATLPLPEGGGGGRRVVNDRVVSARQGESAGLTGARKGGCTGAGSAGDHSSPLPRERARMERQGGK